MLRQRNWSGTELKAFVEALRRNDPSLFAELDEAARRATAGELPEGLDPASVALNESVTESAVGGDFLYESIILRTGRPVLAIQRDAVDVRVIDDEAAETIRDRLHAANSFLQAAIPAVGRIEVQNNPHYDWVGTGWMVDTDIVVTNRHVAQAFGMRDAARFVFRPGLDVSRPQTGRIDFLEEIGNGEAIEVALAEIVWIAPDAGPDVAFLRLASTRANRIDLADTPPAAGAHVAVIGYPARDSRVPDSDFMDGVYGRVYDKKRLAPGQLTAAAEGELQHDCTTLGGNSGSVLLDLATGKAAGLHFSGLYMRSNYAVPASIVRDLMDRRPWQGSDAPVRALAPAPRVAAAGMPAGLTITPIAGGVSLGLPLSLDIRLVASTGAPPAPPAAAATSVERATATARDELAGNRSVVSVRPGYVFRGGWITPERAVVVRLRPDATTAVDAAALAARLGVPVEVCPADPAEVLATAWGLGAAEAPHRYVSNYRRALTGEFTLAPVRVDAITCHASPDAGWPTLSHFLDGVTENLAVAIYDFSAPHIIESLEATFARLPGGKRLSLVLDPKESFGTGTKKDDRPEAEVIDRLAAVDGLDFEHAFVPMRGPRRPFDSAYHIKVAVADRDRFWLSSGNWQTSNQPAGLDLGFGPGQDPAALRTYNREWHAVVESPALAAIFHAHIARDLADALAFPSTEALDLSAQPSFLVPVELLEVPVEELPARATYFAPHRATDVNVLPLLSPDNYAAETLAFVQRARRKLLIQNQSFKPGLGVTEPRFAAILDAILAKQRHGVDVRIIFRRIGDVRDTLERIQAYGFDTSQVHLQTNLHTKGIIVDDEAVMLGSHNFTTAGVVYNRDASLIVEDPGVADYFSQLFEFDWERTAAARAEGRPARPVIEVPPGAETTAPAGYVRMSWHEWTGE